MRGDLGRGDVAPGAAPLPDVIRSCRWPLAAVLLLAGCGPVCPDNFDLGLTAQDPVAVGATAGAEVVDTHRSYGKGDTCTTEDVWARSASVDDPSVFALQPLDGSFVVVLTALAPGTTTLRVEGESAYGSESLSVSVRARAADQVTLALPGGCAAPLRYGTDHEFLLDFELLGGGEHLWGWGLLPFTSAVASVVETRSGADQVAFLTASSTGSGTITSPIDASLQVAIEVFGAGDVQALGLSTQPYAVLRPLGDLHVDADAQVAAGTLCDDTFARQAIVATPSTCLLNRYYDFGADDVFFGPGFVVRGVAQGDCTVTVSLVARPEVTVTRTFTVGP